MEYKKEIEKICESNFQEESCGLLIKNNYKYEITKNKNIHPAKEENFLINYTDYINENPILIWHNHINQTEEPSESDLISSRALGVPFLIYSNQSKGFYLHIPNSYRNKSFKQRTYLSGIFNCGTLIIDYYNSILKKEIKTEGINFINEDLAIEEIEKNNFTKTNFIKKNNIIKFKIKNEFHFGIYLGNQMFLHQMRGTLVHKSKLDDRWFSRVYKIFRYKD